MIHESHLVSISKSGDYLWTTFVEYMRDKLIKCIQCVYVLYSLFKEAELLQSIFWILTESEWLPTFNK